MKNIFISVMVVASVAFAGNCYKIKDKDAKAFCEATAEGKKSCYKIKDKDQKAYCEAIAEGKKSCYKIKSKDKKAMCKAQTGQ